MRRIECKLVATVHHDVSKLVLYSLMERLFNNITQKLKVGPFVHVFRTLKFL